MNLRRALFVSVLAFPGLATPGAAVAPDFWDDRPLRIVQTTPANFPAAVAAEGIMDGEVRAVLQVDAAGKLVDCLVTAYTRREFADELESVVREWTYQPARSRGEPVGTRCEVTFSFHGRGMVLSLSAHEVLKASTARFGGTTLMSLRCLRSELDEPIRALHQVEPRHPGKPAKRATSPPSVVIDFYIDSEGRPRMPAVVSATHDVYAIAVVEAIVQWRFVPPTRQGRPMIVRATQLFSFADSAPK